ncbi:unnamed protein product [Phytomonas sp. Hart1]|nr:unnamed protein product [Phytomonas sp. Hart1]|eukprot:CCW68443.1 unnamed protein product [Phytomonas sp. isolate Hart1]
MAPWFRSGEFFSENALTWIRRGLVLLGVLGVWGDYYQTHYYHAFDPAEGTLYLVDCTPIGRYRSQMFMLPSNYYTNYSPWTPRNGDVVIAREVESDPNFLQLLSGRFVEKQTCGVPLLRPVEEVKREKKEEQELQQKYLEMLDTSKGTYKRLFK